MNFTQRLIAILGMIAAIPPIAAGQDAPATQPVALHTPMFHPNETDPWKAVLPGNITIELLGISENPSVDRPWWHPDGSPLAVVPDLPAMGRVTEQGKVARKMFLKIDDLATSANFIWEVDGRGVASTDRGNDFCLAVAMVSPDRAAVTVDIGIASEAWKQIASRSSGAVAVGGPNEILCAEPNEKDGDIVLNMTHDVMDVDMRVVAIDHNGQTHPAERTGSIGVGDMKMYTVVIPKLAIVDVKEFQFQTRQWQWVEFKNVAMKPAN